VNESSAPSANARSVGLLAPTATEDTRRHALMPFEGNTEVRDVRIADASGKLFDRQASVEQKGARYLVPSRQHEGANALAEHRIEITLQPERVGAENVSELVDSRRVLQLCQQAERAKGLNRGTSSKAWPTPGDGAEVRRQRFDFLSPTRRTRGVHKRTKQHAVSGRLDCDRTVIDGA
jgi:hypothetical protein